MTRMAVAEDAFHSDACSVWVGEQHVSIERVLAADDQEMHAIPGRLTLAFRGGSGRGMTITQLHSAHTISDTTATVPVPVPVRRIFINEDAIHMVEVYCASPFSASVVVQIDSPESSSQPLQQCFFFGMISPCAEKEDDHDKGFFGVPDSQARCVDVVRALHLHLPEVPLAPHARALLAARTAQEASETGSVHQVRKRRRTLTSAHFYGQKQVKAERASSMVATDTTASTRRREGETSWIQFYERLQFNVSHSLLCQLEGTAPLSASFPRQQEAFAFADHVNAFRTRLQRARMSRGESPSNDHDASDVGQAPRLFCFEGANEGKRRFWVTTMSAFWKEYTAIPAGRRHVYEIIREDTPCRLYFDLEYKKELNPDVDGDALVTRLISLLQLQIYRKYHLLIHTDRDIVQLESSTPAKFSRHLTVHFPHGALFVDNLHAGAFVRQFIHDLIVNQGRRKEHSDTAVEVDNLSSDSTSESPFLINDSEGQKQLFIDVGVYTRNRMFRVLGSSKYHKTAVLRGLDAPPTQESDQLDRELFLRSIVCPFTRATVDDKETKTDLLHCFDGAKLKRFGGNGEWSARMGTTTMKSIEARTSVYPELDAFIRSIATTGGVQGEIRAVHLLYPLDPVPPQIESSRRTIDGPKRANTPPQANTEPGKIVYHMQRNRWCVNIGRPHKSNNVMFVVDLAQRMYFQKCHDPRCQAMDFRSEPSPLPSTIHLESSKQVP